MVIDSLQSESGRLLNSSQTEIYRRPSIINSQKPTLETPHPENDNNNNNNNNVANHSSSSSSPSPMIGPSLQSTLTSTSREFFTPTITQLIFCISGWYIFSLTISLYNKWMFDKSKLNLPFPILITSFHQLLLSVLSYCAIWWRPTLRPEVEVEDQDGMMPTTSNSNSNKHSVRFYLTHILPCAMASAGDIGSGNMSFRFITLTTYTMVKSSSIAFVLLFGVICRLEKFSLNLLGIVLLMSFGVMLMVDNDNDQDNSIGDDGDSEGENSGEPQHFYLGFSLVLMSSCMSGLRWVFTQLLLHKNKELKGKKNPIVTIYQLSPPMFVVLFCIGLGIEGFGSFIRASIWEDKGIVKTLILLLIPGILVFFMTIFEFAILQRAQVITLSIAGIFKEILTIIVSTFIFHDRLTFMNFIGLVITLVDIIWYNYYRYLERIKGDANDNNGYDINNNNNNNNYNNRDRYELESV